MELIIILLLILLNGIFSMSEIAMVSSRKSRLEGQAKRGDKSAQKVLELSLRPGRFLSTVQIGITLIGILTGIYSGEKIEDDMVGFYNRFELLQNYSKTLAVSTIVVLLTFFSLVLGELVPKRIGLIMPEAISKTLAYPMYWISLLMAPFIWLLTIASDFLIALFRIKASTDSHITEEEIKALIREGTEGGSIQEIEQEIVHRVFNLGDRKVASLMTHRNDVVFFRIDESAEAVRNTVNRELHSVYPVINADSDVVGLVSLKDLFHFLNQPDFALETFAKPPQYVSEHLTAYEALILFKQTKIHQAVVMDEFGQMQGIITMNDLLEALVGDVSDFYESEFDFVQRPDGSWLVDGQYPLIEFLHRFDLDDLIQLYPFNTLSGLILDQFRKIPATGDTLRWRNFEIEIVDMDGARIDKVLVTQKTDPSPGVRRSN